MRKHKKKPYKRMAKYGRCFLELLAVLANIVTILGFILSLIKK